MEQLVINSPIPMSHAVLVDDIVIKKNRINVIKGDNGVGKSSLFNYLTFHQSVLENSCNFMPQRPLVTLSNMTVSNLFKLYFENDVCVDKPFFKLRQLLEKKVKSLSGGENQLLKLFLSLKVKKKYYVLDEPFTYLDSETKNGIVEYIKGLSGTVIVIDHSDLLDGHIIKLKRIDHRIEVQYG